jgi:hypothetical protein
MSLSAKQAADAVGMTKQGIIKSIKEGKISGAKDQNGHWLIDPAELFRVYPSCSEVDSQPSDSSSLQFTNEVDSSLLLKNRELELKLEAAHKQIESLKEDKEDYKNRLNVESEERRKLTMVLTDMRTKGENERKSESPRKKLFGFIPWD